MRAEIPTQPRPVLTAVWSPTAGCFVIRETAPPSPAIKFVRSVPLYLLEITVIGVCLFFCWAVVEVGAELFRAVVR